MICEKCNKNIDDDSKFCSFCGNKIEKKVYLKLFIYWNALFLLVLTLFFYKIKFLSIVF